MAINKIVKTPTIWEKECLLLKPITKTKWVSTIYNAKQILVISMIMKMEVHDIALASSEQFSWHMVILKAQRAWVLKGIINLITSKSLYNTWILLYAPLTSLRAKKRGRQQSFYLYYHHARTTINGGTQHRSIQESWICLCT